MRPLSRLARARIGAAAALLGTAGITGAGAARAADFEDYGPPRGTYEQRFEERIERGPVYVRPPYAPPRVVERRVEIEEGACRVYHRPRLDAYGREVLHRMRVCDEGVVHRDRRWAERGPDYGERAPVYGEARRYDVPRPPRAVGPAYDDDLD